MNMIVVGCGRIGAELAFRLYQKGHRVTIVDQENQAFTNLHPDFRGRTIEGEALNQDVLTRAGIETADGLAAVTKSDSLNAVVAHIARTAYKVPNVVVRNYDPQLRHLHEGFGLQTVGSSSWGAQRIEELLHHAEMRTVFSAGNGEVEIYEFTIPKYWEGHRLEELLHPSDCSPVSLARAGRAVLPSGDTVLKESDVILVSATFEGIEALRKRLHLMQEG
jgi:trk system potassium uptake protein TrkA